MNRRFFLKALVLTISSATVVSLETNSSTTLSMEDIDSCVKFYNDINVQIPKDFQTVINTIKLENKVTLKSENDFKLACLNYINNATFSLEG